MTEPTLMDFAVSPRFDVEEVDACLKHWGAAVLPGWLSGTDLAALCNDWEAMRALRNDPDNGCVSRVGGDAADYASLDRSNPAARRFRDVDRVFDDGRMRALCERYLGRPFLMNQEVYATYDRGTGSDVVGSHFDKTHTIKFMIYLHDILESGYGAFSVHPGSHKLGRRQFRAWFDRHERGGEVEVGTDAYYAMNNEQVPDDIPPCVEIHAPAGTLIVFSTDVFHRGSTLMPGRERRIMRAHSHPGYAQPGPGTKIRRQSRQWLRGENWETHGRPYSRLSRDGLVELRDFGVARYLRLALGA